MRSLFVLLSAMLVLVGSAVAEAPRPTGDIVLRVSGAISSTNGDGVAEFDMAMLDGLESGTITTTTPWYDGPKTFSGPTGRALLETVGAHGTTLRVTALNDYVTEIPVADFMDLPVLLATRLDGEPMAVRDKGPIFVIYPFDQIPSLNNETYYGRSAWQVMSIEVY